jgi:hypothetical protein
MSLTKSQTKYVHAIIEHASTVGVAVNKLNFSRAELRLISLTYKSNDDVPNWIVKDHSRRVGRGLYAVPEVMDALNVSPGHGNDEDDLSNTTETHAPDVTHVVSDDMGEHVVSDEMLHHVVETS